VSASREVIDAGEGGIARTLHGLPLRVEQLEDVAERAEP
jgi:hypothetical protein